MPSVWLRMGCPACGEHDEVTQWYHSTDGKPMIIDHEADVYHDSYVHMKKFSGMYFVWCISLYALMNHV